MKRHLHLIVSTALATGLIAAGCGDDDDESGGSSLSKDEFIVKANDICTKGTTELNQAAEETLGAGQQPSPAEEEEFVRETVVPSIQGQIDDIRELVPEDEADEVNGILDEAELLLQDLEEDPSGAQGDPFAEVNDDLTEYGLSACASG